MGRFGQGCQLFLIESTPCSVPHTEIHMQVSLPLKTRGKRIVDTNNNTVRLRCVNWCPLADHRQWENGSVSCCSIHLPRQISWFGSLQQYGSSVQVRCPHAGHGRRWLGAETRPKEVVPQSSKVCETSTSSTPDHQHESFFVIQWFGGPQFKKDPMY